MLIHDSDTDSHPEYQSGPHKDTVYFGYHANAFACRLARRHTLDKNLPAVVLRSKEKVHCDDGDLGTDDNHQDKGCQKEAVHVNVPAMIRTVEIAMI